MKRFVVMLFFTAVVLSLVLPAHAADTLGTRLPRNKYLSLRYLHGPVFDHRHLSGVLDYRPGDGIAAEYLVETDGSRAWENIFGLPRLGAAVY